MTCRMQASNRQDAADSGRGSGNADREQDVAARQRASVSRTEYPQDRRTPCDELCSGFEALSPYRTREWEGPWTLVGGSGGD